MAYQNMSRESVDSLILDVLRGAGIIGLCAADISQLIGLPSPKDAIPRLHHLVQMNLLERQPGDIWRIKENNNSNGNQESSSKITESQQQPTTEGTALPQINLPGIGKFNSYKNSLQEYCQKLKGVVPVYKTRHDHGSGYISTVSFSTNTITGSKYKPSSKDAELLAAFEALKQLGYFSEEVQFEHTNVLKRKNNSEQGTPPAKQQRSSQPDTVAASCKSKLNELAQKRRLSNPTYNTVAVNNGFFSTVDFNGHKFKSEQVCTKKKEAEQSAASIALKALLGDAYEPPDPAPQTETDISSMISAARTAASKSAPLKNRLQEYCQRLKKDLPKYSTAYNEDRTYTSNVVVDGKIYNGETKPNKKAAEMSAAEDALKTLGLMA